MADLSSPRVQYRLCGIALRVLWLLTFASAAVTSIAYSPRMALVPLVVGFGIIALCLLRRDYIARRMEQRRKPYRVKSSNDLAEDDDDSARGEEGSWN